MIGFLLGILESMRVFIIVPNLIIFLLLTVAPILADSAFDSKYLNLSEIQFNELNDSGVSHTESTSIPSKKDYLKRNRLSQYKSSTSSVFCPLLFSFQKLCCSDTNVLFRDVLSQQVLAYDEVSFLSERLLL